MLLVYALLNEDSKPRSWRLRLTSDEHDIDQPLRAGSDFSYPRAVGASDVDGDGDQHALDSLQEVLRAAYNDRPTLERNEDSLVIEDYNDPDLDPYYRVACDGFVYPS